jgi:dipeptidyl aminopeptidase/acylaminoacyl peptidase
VAYGRIEDCGLEDHIAAIRELALRDSSVDVERVGIYGHSGGGYAAARAILAHPDFFKVAVASAGTHDQRGYLAEWGERYHGLPGETDYTQQSNAQLAANLRGKLLLCYGGMDDNVPPALTLQLVDALIQQNRDFDLLVLPNDNHSFRRSRSYFTRRRWDYFVRHLLGLEPPQDYKVGG